MNAKGRIISTLLVIDTFFVSYAVGFNSRHVLIVDPTMKAYEKPASPELEKPVSPPTKPVAARGSEKKETGKGKASGKSSSTLTPHGASSGKAGAAKSGTKNNVDNVHSSTHSTKMDHAKSGGSTQSVQEKHSIKAADGNQ